MLKNSIRWKFLLILVLMSVATLLLSLSVTFWVIDTAQENNFHDSFNRTRQVVKGQLESDAYRLSRNVDLISNLPILRAVMELKDPATTRDSAQAYQDDLKLPIFLVLGPEGEVLANVGRKLSKLELDELRHKMLGPLEDGILTSMLSVGENIYLGSASFVGQPEERLGYLILGSHLDHRFTEKVRALTGTTVAIALGGRVSFDLPNEALNYLREVDKEKEASKFEEKHIEDGLVGAYRLAEVMEGTDGYLILSASNSESVQAKSRLIKRVAVIAVVILVVSFLLGGWLARSLSMPIIKLTKMAKNVTATKDLTLRIEVDRTDEAGQLSQSINLLLDEIEANHKELEIYNETLESLVEQRTRQLSEAHDNMERLLNNLSEGYMVIEEDGAVMAGASANTEVIFGKDPTLLPFSELIGQTDQEKANIDKWLTVIFTNETVTFEDLVRLGPQSVVLGDGEKYIDLRYRPIFDDYGDFKQLSKVICIATDKSEERKAKKRLQEEQMVYRMITSVAKSRGQFASFVKGTRKMIGVMRAGAQLSDSELKRSLHTIKGNASLFYVREMVNLVHQIESDFKEGKFDQNQMELRRAAGTIQKELDNTLEKITAVLGDLSIDKEMKMVDVKNLEEMAVEIAGEVGVDSYLYGDFIRQFVLSDVSIALMGLETKIRQVALNQNKDVNFAINNKGNVHVYLPHYQELFGTFVHIVTNSIVHGIESGDVRLSKGKGASGQILIEVDKEKSDKDHMIIRVQDDGRGIEVDKVIKKAIELGICDEERVKSMSREEVLQLVFVDEFSTAGNVSTLAGRGVGLAAVKDEAEKLGGKVFVETEPGRGTQFILKIPLTQFGHGLLNKGRAKGA